MTASESAGVRHRHRRFGDRDGATRPLPEDAPRGPVDEARRERFFSHSHGSYGVAKEIRDLCTFSVHNLVRDPPFSHDEPGLLPQFAHLHESGASSDGSFRCFIIPWFREASCSWAARSPSRSMPDLFETVDKKARIFRRRQGRSPELNLSWQHVALVPSLGTSCRRRPPDERGSKPAPVREASRNADRDVPRDARAGFDVPRATITLLGPVPPSAEIVVRAASGARGNVRGASVAAPKNIKPRSKSCAAPMRSCIRSTRKCNRPTRSSRPRRRSCNRSTRSCTPSTSG